MGSLCLPCVTTTHLSYRFPIFETSATTLCGTTNTSYYHIIILSYYIYIIRFYMHLYYLYTALASLNYSRQDKSCLTQSAGASSRTSPFTTLGVQQPENSGAPKYRTGQPIKIQIRKKICRVQRLNFNIFN